MPGRGWGNRVTQALAVSQYLTCECRVVCFGDTQQGRTDVLNETEIIWLQAHIRR